MQKMSLMSLLTCRRCRSWFCENAEDVARDFVNMQKMSLMILWKRKRCLSWFGKQFRICRSWFYECPEDVAHCFAYNVRVLYTFVFVVYTIKQTSLDCQHLVLVNMQSLFHESRSWILIVRYTLSTIYLHYSVKYNIHLTHQQIRSKFFFFKIQSMKSYYSNSPSP